MQSNSPPICPPVSLASPSSAEQCVSGIDDNPNVSRWPSARCELHRVCQRCTRHRKDWGAPCQTKGHDRILRTKTTKTTAFKSLTMAGLKLNRALTFESCSRRGERYCWTAATAACVEETAGDAIFDILSRPVASGLLQRPVRNVYCSVEGYVRCWRTGRKKAGDWVETNDLNVRVWCLLDVARKPQETVGV